MGVAGSGKTSVGRQLAGELGVAFFDGDDFHPQANRAKMARGEPLTDADRGPWLDALAKLLTGLVDRGEGGVLASSALKERYRARLAVSPAVTLVQLEVPRDELARRLAARRDHFFTPALLDTQLAALEAPGPGVLVVDGAHGGPGEVAARVRRALEGRPPPRQG